MNDLLRSFARALVGTLHPRVLLLTFMPFVVAAVIWGALLWFFWQSLTHDAYALLTRWGLTSVLYPALDLLGFPALRSVIAPLLVIAVAIPPIVMTVLLLIAIFAVPMVLRHLAARQFSDLQALRGGSWYGSLFHTVLATLICLALLIVTLPLWLIPPLFALIPPLLWGWLTYRVMTYDALALHASRDERRTLLRQHRLPLLTIGIISGLLGSLPTLLWVSSVWLIVLFPIITAATIWAYAFILMFSALWFSHYCLSALRGLRQQQ